MDSRSLQDGQCTPCFDVPALSRKGLLRSKVLAYEVHRCSSTSANYVPENILVDKPSNQLSRWSSDTNTPPQYLVLNVASGPAVVTHITFGKYEKTHVCNLKRFKIYGGCEESNMMELLDGGLKNDSRSETFPLSHLLNGQYFPCRYIKIVPIQSWGPSFNFSIWFVGLEGDASPCLVDPAIEFHRQFREREALRLCLKLFRQKNLTEVFECLQKNIKVQLEHRRLTELHRMLVDEGDYKATESLITAAVHDGLFDDFIDAQQPVPKWAALISPEVSASDEPLSGSATPFNATPTVSPGNLTPEQEEHNRPQVSINRQGANMGGVIPDPRRRQSSLRSQQETSAGSDALMSGVDEAAGLAPPPPDYPESRGGHQMVIDSASQLMYMFGGWNGSRDLSDFWSYNLSTEKWLLVCSDTSAVGGPSARSCHKMVIDCVNKHIFVLGRYLDRLLREESENVKSDFYMYDIGSDRWIMITDDTAAMGGPSLIFDHQMCLDHQQRKIYVFGGHGLCTSAAASQQNSEKLNATAGKSYSGLYEYVVPTNSWAKLRDDVDSVEPNDREHKALKSRSSHSMLFHPGLRKLFIFGGQRRRDEYLNDFFTYSVDTNEVEVITGANSSLLSNNDPTAAIPAVGYTQRATIDCQRSEIHVMTGLNKDKSDKKSSSAVVASSVSNSFWVYGIKTNRWKCFYRNENCDSGYWSEHQINEPRPRYAHQLVYDEVNTLHYMFGGNPGGKEGKENKLRLGDFWRLKLVRPSRNEILRRCAVQIRRTRFVEMSWPQNKDGLMEAARYLQHELAGIIDHADKEEVQCYHKLANLLFEDSSSPCQSPLKRSRSTENRVAMAKSQNLDEMKHDLRTNLFDELTVYFPDSMTQPKGNLLNLVPQPTSLS